jgi:molybdopterin-guanine dinucleotide biosynthesis protein
MFLDFKGGLRMATKINFTGRQYTRTLYFSDLALAEGFKIVGGDAVYQKIASGRHGTESQLEIATGKYFPATESPVERVDIMMTVSAPRPSNVR